MNAEKLTDKKPDPGQVTNTLDDEQSSLNLISEKNSA